MKLYKISGKYFNGSSWSYVRTEVIHETRDVAIKCFISDASAIHLHRTVMSPKYVELCDKLYKKYPNFVDSMFMPRDLKILTEFFDEVAEICGWEIEEIELPIVNTIEIQL